MSEQIPHKYCFTCKKDTPIGTDRGYCYEHDGPRVTVEQRTEHFETTGAFESDDKILKDLHPNVTPNYYGATCKCGRKMDPYTICDAYPNIQESAHHHAVKKLLRVGSDSHKPKTQDIQEVIDSLNRWLEQLGEK